MAVFRDDLVDVQKAVLLEADVDERGLHSGEHVVDSPLVDVADDRPPPAPLDVELGDAPTRIKPRKARPASTASALRGVLGRRALPFDDRDAGLAAIDGN